MDISRARLNRIKKILNDSGIDVANAAKHRNDLLGEARRDGYINNNELGNWLFDLLTPKEPDEDNVPYNDGYGDLRELRRGYEEPQPVRRSGPRLGIHELANQMAKDGYFGQMMRDEDNAKAYICMAADNPNVEDELPPAGFSFWRAAPVSYKRWKALKNHGFE